MTKQQTLDYSVHRYYGIHFNRKAWEMLQKPSITIEEGYKLIDMAHASNHHWRFAGTAVNQQRGAYMIASVYLAVGSSDAAIIYAKRCWDITQKKSEDLKDFDYAYAEEMMWKCELAEGNIEKAATHKKEARRLGDNIQGEEDKEIFDKDFEMAYVNLMQ